MRLAIVFFIVMSALISSSPVIARDLSASELPNFGDRADKIASRLASARDPGTTVETYFVTLSGHRTTFRPHYYKDHGVERLAAVDIGYVSQVIPFAAFHDFMYHFLPNDIVKVPRSRYTVREKVETDAAEGETDEVFSSLRHARNIGAVRPCQSGVSLTGLITAVERRRDGQVIRARVESEYGTFCWQL